MHRFLLFILLVGCTCLQGIAQKTGKDPKSKPYGDAIFSGEQIHEIKINFLQCEAWDSLLHHKQLRDSLNLKKYLQGNVEVNGKKYFACGVRIKGESSFDFYPGNKKSIKINFGKYNKKQKLNGLKTINLNNAFKDPSFMREKLWLDFLNSEGIAAPRCSYARLWINGEFYGLYTLVEEINRGFLKHNFKNKKGSFFQGEPKASFEYLGQDINTYMYCYKNKSKTDSAYFELLDLIKSINRHELTDHSSLNELEEILNVEDCLKVFAISNLMANVDAYNIHHRHNFYLYRNMETGKFEWIPYDGNYSFCAFSSIFKLKDVCDLSVFYMTDRHEVPLLRHLFGVEKYRAFYINYIKELLGDSFTEKHFNKEVDRLARQIRRSVYEDNKKMYTNQEFEKNLHTEIGDINDPGSYIPGLKSLVKARIQAVKKELKIEEAEK
jgi:hypothetical protein